MSDLDMAIIFQSATRDDAERAEALMRESFRTYRKRIGKGFSAEWADHFARILARGDVHVGLVDKDLVAVAMLEHRTTELYVDQIGVASEFQGQGIGTWLMASIEVLARRRGHARIVLETAETMPENLRFYGLCGFTELRRGPPTHGQDTVNRVYFEKTLRRREPVV